MEKKEWYTMEEMEARIDARAAWDKKHPVLSGIRNFWYKIVFFWNNTLTPRVLVRRIKSVLYWIPIAWDQDWYDWHYILAPLQHQLKLMVSKWEHDTCYEGSEVQFEQLKRALELTTRILDDDYPFNPGDSWEECDRAMKNDVDELFTLMSKHLREWWD